MNVPRAKAARGVAAVVAMIAVAVGLAIEAPDARAATTQATPISDPGAYVALSPQRVLDTRADGQTGVTPAGSPVMGPIADGQTIDVKIAGVGGVPTSGASAVVLDVTVTAPAGSGFLTVYPGDSPAPVASNLNYSAGQTIANLVTVRLGAVDGDVKIVTHGASLNVVADVQGYYLGGGAPSAAGAFAPLAPVRLLDTRTGNGATGGQPLAAGSDLTLQVAGGNGVPAGAAAAVINVAVTQPSGEGFLTVYPATASTAPLASNLNFTPGETIPNLVTAALDGHGALKVHLSIGTAHVVVDLSGYYLGGAAADPGTFHSMAPTRVLDTRVPIGQSTANPLSAGNDLTLQLAGTNGIPADAQAVVENIAVTQPTNEGYLATYPADGTWAPNVSNLNFAVGEAIANLATTRLGNGGVRFHLAVGTAHVIADVAGYFRGGSAPATGTPRPALGVHATALDSSAIQVDWTNPTGATSVTLCRMPNGTAPTSPACSGGVALKPPAGSNHQIDGGLNPSTTYYYTVFATGGAGTSGPSNTASSTTATPAPSISWNFTTYSIDGLQPLIVFGQTANVPAGTTVQLAGAANNQWGGWNDAATTDANGNFNLAIPTQWPATTQWTARVSTPTGIVQTNVAQLTTNPALQMYVRQADGSDVQFSYRSGCPVGPDQLHAYQFMFLGADGIYHWGHLVARNDQDSVVSDVFANALASGYYFTQINTADVFGGDDPTMINNDDTSAFNCRHVTGDPYALSPHSYGTAYDINDVENPYQDNSGNWWPANFGAQFRDRSQQIDGRELFWNSMVVYQFDRVHGIGWGAGWSHPDYQHFDPTAPK